MSCWSGFLSPLLHHCFCWNTARISTHTWYFCCENFGTVLCIPKRYTVCLHPTYQTSSGLNLFVGPLICCHCYGFTSGCRYKQWTKSSPIALSLSLASTWILPSPGKSVACTQKRKATWNHSQHHQGLASWRWRSPLLGNAAVKSLLPALLLRPS